MSAANNNASIEDQRTSPATLTPVYVNASAPVCTSDCGTASKPYQTLAAAITRVAPGGTIHVAAGSYTENLVVNKDVTISGTNGSVLNGTIQSRLPAPPSRT